MTRSTRWRLRSLERRVRAMPCALCAGASARAVARWAGEAPRSAEPCPACGRATVTVLRLGPRQWTRPLGASEASGA
jgi:hypothetical protein